MRVAVVDIGSNSTRLLIAAVEQDGAVTELVRRSEVTRLGQGVDHAGVLADEAMARVYVVLDSYRAAIDEHGAGATIAVLTSAVRDARNGAAFTARVRDQYGLDTRTLSGDEEARMSFLGAVSARAADDRTLVVIDIGGGSTELVVGSGREVLFHTSTQAGVVRQSERHIRHDPPEASELQALADEVAEIYTAAVPADIRERTAAAIAVAGTATSCAAMAQELEPYDPARVHGYRLSLAETEMLLARVAAMTEERRRHVPGLHPDRAPTIVAGVIMLAEALRAFGLDQAEVSENDILRGAALVRAAEEDASGGTGLG